MAVLSWQSFFLFSKTPREMGAQTAVEKFTISKSNFFTNHYQSLMIIKSLPVSNIHLLAFYLPRLSMLLKLISLSHRYVPSYSDFWYPLSHPIQLFQGMHIFPLGQRPDRLDIEIFSFVPIGDSNCIHIAKITQETWFGIWIRNDYSEILFCMIRYLFS